MGKKKKSTQHQQQGTSQGAQQPAPQGAQQPAPQGAQQQQSRPPSQESQSSQRGSQPPQRTQHSATQSQQQRVPRQQEHQHGQTSQQPGRQPAEHQQSQQQQPWQGSQRGQPRAQYDQPSQQQSKPALQGPTQPQQSRQGQPQPRQGQQGIPAQQGQRGPSLRQPQQPMQGQPQPWQGQGGHAQQGQRGPPLQQQQPMQGQPQPWQGQQGAHVQQGQRGPSLRQPQQPMQGQPQPWQGQGAHAQQGQRGPPLQQQQPMQGQPQPWQGQQQVPTQGQHGPPQQQIRQPQQQQAVPQHLLTQQKMQMPSQPSSRDVSHSPSPVHELKRTQVTGVQETPSQSRGDAAQPSEGSSSVQTKPPPQGDTPASKGMELAIPHRSKLNKTGTKGRSIAIETNHLLLQISDLLKSVIHYDVAIDPDKPKKLLRVVMEDCRKKNYGDRFPAYDGSKSLYSSSLLPFGKHMSDEIRIIENDREKIFKVTIKQATTIDLNILKRYFTSAGTGRTIEIPQDAIQCLDVVLRSAPSLRCIPVGRSFFTKPERFLDLGEGMEMYHGFFQSAILGWKPFLNVDVAHKAFPKSLGIVNLITELCEDQPLSAENIPKIDKFLRNLKVRYEIPNQPSSKRISRVNQLDKPASAARFKDENGREMTVADYYTKNKNYKLKYPHLPCLWIGSRDRKILYPPELCTLLEGQVTNRAMTPNQTSKMIRHAATPCDERKRKIMASVTAASFNTDACVREFGISVSNQFTKIDARVLSSPRLLYSDKRTVQPAKGVWRADKFQVGKLLTKWAILGVDGRTREQALQVFAEKMISQGRMVGMTIEKPSSIIVRRLSYRSPKEDLKSEFTKLEDFELVVVVIPDDKDTYGYVKQVAELNMGTLTQCVRGKNVFNAKDATVANILLKVNAKLNGVNHSLHVTPVCLRRPCMIMGADVTHPSPESRGTTPSVAAVTASHDPKAFQYNISWRLQPPTQEIITDLANIVREHLLFFYRKNKAKPERIVFFRDGVSEGQFRQVLQSEVTAIRNACLMLQKDGSYQPKVTFLVVQKRHHTRFFPQNQRDSEDRNSNVPAGTIVDTDITHPTDVDFYLVSHASIQGTARPTRYRKLWDDCDMDEDELEELTYHLCHMFTRCTRSVSYPAPTYYAHLAAARAKVYCENMHIDVDNLGRTQAQLVIRPEIITGMPMFFV